MHHCTCHTQSRSLSPIDKGSQVTMPQPYCASAETLLRHGLWWGWNPSVLAESLYNPLPLLVSTALTHSETHSTLH